MVALAPNIFYMLRGPRLNYFFRLSLDFLVLIACFEGISLLSPFLGQTLTQLSTGWLLFSIVTWYVTARALHFYTSITLFTYSQEMTIFIRLLFTHLLQIGRAHV